jgi:hypothetical protein
MIDIIGFAHIKKDASTCKGAKNPNEFLGEICAVMEFGVDDCVLVLNPKQTALAMFDKEDVLRSFKCIVIGNTICPPNQHPLETMVYVGKCIERKGGYDNIVRNMVIESSLAKGEFYDNFLWQLQ